MPAAGGYDRRITIQAEDTTPNTYNEKVKSWADVLETWARVQYINGAEAYQSDQLDAQRIAKFYIRWRDDVTIDEKRRVVFDGQTFEITSVLEQGRRRELLIMAFAHVP